MTASPVAIATAVGRPAEATRRRAMSATLVLARREALLLVRHPLHVAGLTLGCAIPLLNMPAGTDSRQGYFDLALGVLEFDGILTFFAAHRCATRMSRAHADGWLAATVTTPASRTVAMVLATLAPFGLACLVLAAGDPLVAAYTARSADPGVVRLFGNAICVLGAGLLGVAVARWLRFPGAAMATMVAVVAASAWADAHGHTLLQPQVEWAQWLDNQSGGPFIGVAAGSPAWHALSMTAWTVLAGGAALAAHRRYRIAALAVGIAAGVVIVVAGRQLY